jgi:hypothetical protein
MTVDGWQRTCPGCGTCDGDLAQLIALPLTFRCVLCGHVWDGSRARLIFLSRPPDPDDDEGIYALVDRLKEAASKVGSPMRRSASLQMLAAMSLGRLVSTNGIVEMTDLAALSTDDGVRTERVPRLEVRSYTGVLLLGRLAALFWHVGSVKGRYRSWPLGPWWSAEEAAWRPDLGWC